MEDASLYLKDEFEKSADDISIVDETFDKEVQVAKKGEHLRKRSKDISAEKNVISHPKQQKVLYLIHLRVMMIIFKNNFLSLFLFIYKVDTTVKDKEEPTKPNKPVLERKLTGENARKLESQGREKKGVKRKRTDRKDEETTVKVVKVQSEPEGRKRTSPVSAKASFNPKPILVKSESVSYKPNRQSSVRNATFKVELATPPKISVKPFSALKSPVKISDTKESPSKVIPSPIRPVNSTVRKEY